MNDVATKALHERDEARPGALRDRLRSLFLEWEYAKLHVRLLESLLDENAPEQGGHREALQRWRQVGRDLRERLITAGVPLALWAVARYNYPDLERDECRSVTLSALVRAVDTFDIRYGTTFSTYASVCMRRALQVEATRVRRCRRRERQAAALDPHLCGRSRDDDGPALAEEAARLVRENLAGLSERERAVLLYRYGLHGGFDADSMMLADVAARLDLAKDAVRRIECAALAKVRHTLTAWREGREPVAIESRPAAFRRRMAPALTSRPAASAPRLANTPPPSALSAVSPLAASSGAACAGRPAGGDRPVLPLAFVPAAWGKTIARFARDRDRMQSLRIEARLQIGEMRRLLGEVREGHRRLRFGPMPGSTVPCGSNEVSRSNAA